MNPQNTEKPRGEETVKEARDRFLATNGFDLGGYTAARFLIPIGRLTLTAPNPGLLMFHDLHHIATGIPPTLLGECQISAYELRTGATRSPVVLVLCIAAILLGLIMSPKAELRIWKCARGTRNLYRTQVPYETLLGMTVGELRESLRIPGGGF